MARLSALPHFGRLGFLLALVAATSCARPRSEPPPPAESFEIASAAPGALGALAAGTDAAPPAVIAGPARLGDLPRGLRAVRHYLADHVAGDSVAQADEHRVQTRSPNIDGMSSAPEMSHHLRMEPDCRIRVTNTRAGFRIDVYRTTGHFDVRSASSTRKSQARLDERKSYSPIGFPACPDRPLNC